MDSKVDNSSISNRAYENFAAEIQKKITSLQQSEAEKNEILKELSKKEFIKLYEAEQNSVMKKRAEVHTMDSEIQMVKR